MGLSNDNNKGNSFAFLKQRAMWEEKGIDNNKGNSLSFLKQRARWEEKGLILYKTGWYISGFDWVAQVKSPVKQRSSLPARH
jgi:hypothetical protein